MAGGSLVKEFCEEVTCPVCLDYFTDPVITGCGHNFCRACLTQCWGEPDKSASCPECREPVQQSSLRPNRKLANFAEITKKFSLLLAKGKKRAGGVCERHQEPLKLFCREDEAPICVVCDRSKEHREHRVIPVEEAAEEYKEKIQAQLPSLEEERERLVELKVAEEQRNRECLLEEEKQEIMSVFKEMHKFLEEQERVWLTRLADLEKEIKEKQEANMTRLSKEISHFSDLIKDVEVKCQQPPSEFLQDIRRTWGRCQEGQTRKQLELSLGLESRLRSCCPNSAVLEKAMKELAGSLKQPLGKVSVTLDPKTAHPRLVLSDDLKSVRWAGTYQNLPDNPGRFDSMFCVLGRERFTSGRHWWEVEVQKLKEIEMWAVGVARESLGRKGYFTFSPNEGIWAVGNNSSPFHTVSAMTSPIQTPLTLSHEPREIQVFLDYEEGRVEFFNADTDDLIFTFTPGSFSGEGIRPFFWVGRGVCLKC